MTYMSNFETFMMKRNPTSLKQIIEDNLLLNLFYERQLKWNMFGEDATAQDKLSEEEERLFGVELTTGVSADIAFKK